MCGRDGVWSTSGACTKATWALKPVSSCAGNCGERLLLDTATGRQCFCDAWCDHTGYCCGGSASKNAACPSMAPSADYGRIISCSSNIGLAPAAPTCGAQSYRPAGCYCDAFCQSAQDCCKDCPGTCDGACAARWSRVGARTGFLDDSELPETRAADPVAALDASAGAGKGCNHDHHPFHQALAAAGNAGPAAAGARGAGVPSASTRAWSAAVENKVVQCSLMTAGMDQATAPAIVVPIVWVSAILPFAHANYTNPGYPVAKQRAVVAHLNKAFARANMRFELAQSINYKFSSIDEAADQASCFPKWTNVSTWNDQCETCQAYRSARRELQNPKTLFLTSIAFEDAAAAFGPIPYIGNSWVPEWIYDPLTANVPYANASKPRDANVPQCVDSAWATQDQDGNPNWSFTKFKKTVTHELGHLLGGLLHTWEYAFTTYNETTWAPIYAPRQQACDEIAAGGPPTPPGGVVYKWNDQVRDTATDPYFVNYDCDPATGDFVPTPESPDTPPGGVPLAACDSTPQNVNNYMAIQTDKCYRQSVRYQVFTPGQLARLRCGYNCYRAGQCAAGTFIV